MLACYLDVERSVEANVHEQLLPLSGAAATAAEECKSRSAIHVSETIHERALRNMPNIRRVDMPFVPLAEDNARRPMTKVLLVDDEPNLVDLVKGYSIERATGSSWRPTDPTPSTGRATCDPIWNNRNLNVVDELAVPEYVCHLAGVPDPVQGCEALKELFAATLAAFDTHVTPEFLIAEGDKVAVHNTCWPKHTGEFHGHPPTDKEVKETSTDLPDGRRPLCGTVVRSRPHRDAAPTRPPPHLRPASRGQRGRRSSPGCHLTSTSISSDRATHDCHCGWAPQSKQ
jgi:SnoaL-like polyketide cyclase